MSRPAPQGPVLAETPGPTLAETLAAGTVLHMPAMVAHARRGAIRHAFAYGVDYLLLDPGRARGNALFSRNRFNLAAVHDRDHGGRRGAGQGAGWARAVLAQAGLGPDVTLALLTQPRFLGYWFTPVAFWLALRGGDLLAVIAEVNNTYGDRHSYLCARPGFAPLRPGDEIAATKVFHVSPFQDIAGDYRFRFDLGGGRIRIRIVQAAGAEGLVATMEGALAPLTAGRTLRAALRRPGGALRVVALIYWNALRLALKGARFRPHSPPPDREVSR